MIPKALETGEQTPLPKNPLSHVDYYKWSFRAQKTLPSCHTSHTSFKADFHQTKCLPVEGPPPTR